MQTFRFGDSVWDILRKILQNQLDLADIISPGSGSGGSSTPSFATAPDITVLVPGTPVQGLDIPTPRGVLVVARQTNTGIVYVGGSDVSNASGGKQGLQLSMLGMPSQNLPVSNVNQIWVNADNGGDRIGLVVL